MGSAKKPVSGDLDIYPCVCDLLYSPIYVAIINLWANSAKPSRHRARVDGTDCSVFELQQLFGHSESRMTIRLFDPPRKRRRRN